MTKSHIVPFVALATALACGGAQKGEPSAPPTSVEAAEAPSVVSVASAAPAPAAPVATAAPAATEATSSSTSTPVAAGGAPGSPAQAAGGVDIGEVQVTGGTLPNLDEVVGSLRQSFAACVARGRAQRPDTEGQIALTIRVGTAGQVLGVAAQQTTKIPASLVSCVSTRAATAQFAPPLKAKSQVAVLVPVVVPKP
jgi:hypothetical protein